jgi:hypothetical protein
LYPQLRQWSMKRAVRNPQRGHSTARSGFATSTYRGLLAAATVDFGFYLSPTSGLRPAGTGGNLY